MLRRFAEDIPGHIEARKGIYHLVGEGATTWYGFARTILERDPGRLEHTISRITPVATREYPTKARRPPYSVLDNRRLKARFGLSLPHWEAPLDDVMREPLQVAP